MHWKLFLASDNRGAPTNRLRRARSVRKKDLWERESRIEISFALNRFRLIISVEQLKDEWGSERLVIESSERRRIVN